MNIVRRIEASLQGMEWADAQLDARHTDGDHCDEHAPCSDACAELWSRWQRAYRLTPTWVRVAINAWYYITLGPLRWYLHKRRHQHE